VHNKLNMEPMPSAELPDWPNDEKGFLDRKAELEKAALAGTLKTALGDAKRAADVGSWVEHYPLPSMITGVAVGLFAAFKLIPNPAASQAAHPSKDLPRAEIEAHESTGKNSGSLWGFLLHAGLGLLKDAVIPTLSQNVADKFRSVPPDSKPDS